MKAFIIIVCLISSLGTSFALDAQYSSLTNGLVAYYPFNGNFCDESGNSNNLITNQGMSFTTDRFGNSNGALLMTLTNSFASSASPIGVSGNSPRTIAFWVETTNSLNSGSGGYDLLNWGYNMPPEYGAIGKSFQVTIFAPINPWGNQWNGAIDVQGAGADAEAGNLGDFTYNKWNHIVCIYNGSVLGEQVYQNGTNIPVSDSPGDSSDVLNTPNTVLRVGDRGSGLVLPGTVLSDVRIYNRALSSNEVTALYTLESTPTRQDLTNGLVAYYPFNGNALDESGNGNNGTVNGCILTNGLFGNSNTAYLFQGNNNITIADSLSLTPNQLTVTCWVNLQNWSDLANLVGKDGASGRQYCLQLHSNGQIRSAVFTSNGESDADSTISITSGTWHQIIQTWDGNFVTAFLDGVAVASSPAKGTLAAGNNPLYIGQLLPNQSLSGLITDVRVYNRALSSNEVAALYTYESTNSSCIGFSTNDETAEAGAWVSYFASNLPSNTEFSYALAANPNFLSALANAFTSSPTSYGVLQQGPQGIQGAQGPVGPQGPVGVFDPTVLTNTAFLKGLATNPTFTLSLATNAAFVSAIAANILSSSNNYGVAIKQNQSLNFPSITTQTLPPGKPITLPISSSAGLIPIIESSGNTAVAIISNNVLTILGAGSTTITATQAGNSLWNPISVSQPLVVNKGMQSIKFPAIPTQSYTTFKTVTLKATSSIGLSNTTYLIDNGAVGSISNNVLLLLGTGTTTITATNSGNAYYNPASATQTLIVK